MILIDDNIGAPSSGSDNELLSLRKALWNLGIYHQGYTGFS